MKIKLSERWNRTKKREMWGGAYSRWLLALCFVIHYYYYKYYYQCLIKFIYHFYRCKVPYGKLVYDLDWICIGVRRRLCSSSDYLLQEMLSVKDWYATVTRKSCLSRCVDLAMPLHIAMLAEMWTTHSFALLCNKIRTSNIKQGHFFMIAE